MRQPLAGWHTVAPVPRSTHRRVQQLEAPAQGSPSVVQPPDGLTQRPGVAAGTVVFVEHPPVQQSWFR